MKVTFTNAKATNTLLKKFAKEVNEAPRLIATRAAFQIMRDVVERTPVDTGWCQNSWRIAQGTPDLSIPPKPSGGQTLNKPDIKPASTGAEFPVWYVTNNLPYAPALEAGHSKQAGKGFMIQRSLAKLDAEINAIMRDVAK